MPDLVLVKTFRNTVEAHIAKNFLEQQGIHATVSVTDAGGTVFGFAGGMAGDGGLFVLENDAEKAIDLLRSSERGEEVAVNEKQGQSKNFLLLFFGFFGLALASIIGRLADWNVWWIDWAHQGITVCIFGFFFIEMLRTLGRREGLNKFIAGVVTYSFFTIVVLYVLYLLFVFD